MPGDPTQDLYTAMDRAGLQASTFYNAKKSTPKIVLEIRTKLLDELKQVIERRDNGITG